MSQDAHTQRLPIFTRRTHGADTLRERTQVRCPKRAEMASLETCWMCVHVEGAVFEPAERQFILECSPPVPTRGNGGAHDTPVSAIMTGEVHCVRPDLALDALADLFLDLGISGAPVVDAHARPIGIITKTDLIQHAREDASRGARARAASEQAAPDQAASSRAAERPATVHDAMLPAAFSVPEHASVAQAAALMAFEQIHHAPVVDSEGKVVGIVSSLDVTTYLARHSGYLK